MVVRVDEAGQNHAATRIDDPIRWRPPRGISNRFNTSIAYEDRGPRKTCGWVVKRGDVIGILNEERTQCRASIRAACRHPYDSRASVHYRGRITIILIVATRLGPFAPNGPLKTDGYLGNSFVARLHR